jgi:hypothetical protein
LQNASEMEIPMNINLTFLKFLIAIVTPVIVGVSLVGLWQAVKRAFPAGHNRVTTWLAVAIPLVLWLALAWVVSAAGLFEFGRIPIPVVPFAVILPPVIALTLSFRSGRIAAVIDAVPASWLIGIQVYRVVGACFLVLWAYGAMPGVFALPAGTGDFLVGLLALPVGFYLASGAARGRAVAFGWNFLGLVDLVTAVTMGVLSSPGPLQILSLDHPNFLTGVYPVVMIPAFGVPLSFIFHGLSLWKLKRGQAKGTNVRVEPLLQHR